jgi:hypothetical protein
MNKKNKNTSHKNARNESSNINDDNLNEKQMLIKIKEELSKERRSTVIFKQDEQTLSQLNNQILEKFTKKRSQQKPIYSSKEKT